MIAAPSTAFSNEEIRTVGTNPFLRFTIYPNYFRNGVGVGQGTFVDTSFVSPDRIQVDDNVGSASWASEVLTHNLSNFPTPIIITWDYDFPGYEGLIEFRTATTETALTLAPYLEISSGDGLILQKYYQWRITFVSYRVWAYDTLAEAEASEVSAWALDIEDPTDPYQSYASESIFGLLESYIENVELIGELCLPKSDILDGGSLSQSMSKDFSNLVSSDHTMQLLNRDYQYSPGHENFIFAGENDWERKNIRMEFGFTTPTGAETGTIVLYVGTILKWGPLPYRRENDGAFDAGSIELYSRDAIAVFMDQKIGVPNADGSPNPVVSGEILRETTKLGDTSLYAPIKDVDYEGAILDELSTVDLSGANNLIELVTTDPYEGSKCLRSYLESGGYARGWLDGLTATDELLVKTAIKFVSIPSPPTAWAANFLRIRCGGADKVILEIDSDYRVHVNHSVLGRKETDWYVNRYQDVWMDLSIGIYGKNPGVLRVFLNGDQILNWDQVDFTSLASIEKVCLGLTVSPGEPWEIHFDSTKIYNIYYPEAYYIPGAPFDDIGTVYIDGAVKVEKGRPNIIKTYSPGKAVSEIDMTKTPALGLVTFNDLANPPSGSVLFKIRKNDTTHPVDAIEAILIAGGQEGLINVASFAAAKAANPNDSIGCYFEDKTIAEAILEIAKRTLYNVIIAQGEIKILPYKGEAPVFYDVVLNTAKCSGFDKSVDSEDVKTKITTKWGQYEQNSRLYYAAQDDDAIKKKGTLQEEIDFSWGGEVGSDNSGMAKNKADWLLARLKGSTILYENVTTLLWQLIRIEMGDKIQVDVSYFGDPEIYYIIGKDFIASPPYELNLTLARFPGEE